MIHPAKATPSRVTSRFGARRGGALKLAAVVVAVAGLAGAGYLVVSSDANAGSDVSGSTLLAQAEIIDFEITTVASGDLEARQRTEIRSQVDGQTAIMYIVPEGQRVEEGELLVRLNSEALQDEVDEEIERVTAAENDVASAETSLSLQLSDNESNLRDAELGVRLAELDLQKWIEGDDVKRREEFRIRIENGQVQLDRLKNKFAQSEQLFEQGFLSADEFELDRIELNSRESDLRIAQLEYETYKMYEYVRETESRRSEVTNAKATLERVKEQNEINRLNRESNLVTARRVLGQRQRRLDEYRDQLTKCELFAPRAGLVVYSSSLNRDDWRVQQEGPIAVGRQVRNNDMIIALPDTSEMLASVKVHESLAGRFQPGQPATVTVDAAGGLRIPATVDSIGLLAEGGGWRDPNRREYTVKLSLNPSEEAIAKIKPSMRCEATVVLGSVEQRLAVPIQAIFNEGAVRYVYSPQGPRFVRVPVSIGQRSNTTAEITAGLEVGDSVLLRRPDAGQIIAEPWDAEQLVAAGYQVGEDGKPMVAPTRRAGRAPAGVVPTSGRPANQG
jgi:HlyD family secretion protein